MARRSRCLATDVYYELFPSGVVVLSGEDLPISFEPVRQFFIEHGFCEVPELVADYLSVLQVEPFEPELIENPT